MGKNKSKVITDLGSIILLLAAIITGFVLHNEVWHLHVYNNTTLWGMHEAIGLVLSAFVCGHCVQHSFWFKNYSKIPMKRKSVSTLLLFIGFIVVLSGIILMCGSHSEAISHVHYVGAILFTIVAVCHIAKRWKILKNLF